MLVLLLSHIGMTAVLLLSATTIRENLLNQRLDTDVQLLVSSLQQYEDDALRASNALTTNQNLAALLSEPATPAQIPTVNEQLTVIRDQFQIDQIILLDDARQVRGNVTQADLQLVDTADVSLLPLCREQAGYLGTYKDTRLLITCAPIVGTDTTAIAYAYAILDLPSMFERIKGDIALQEDVLFLFSDESISLHGSGGTDTLLTTTQSREITIPLGDGQVRARLQVSRQDADAVITTSVQVIMLSSGLTLLVLLGAVGVLANNLSQPILTLTHTADAVANGDLSRRANLKRRDEVGQLGTLLDRGTATIAEMLENRARTVSERQAILQSITNGVLVVDTEERIVMMNPAAATLLGQAPDAQVGQPLNTLADQDDPVLLVGIQQVIAHLRASLHRAAPHLAEEHLSFGNRVVALHNAPVYDSQAICIGAVAVLQDVTQIVAADRAKSTLIATAAHQLRTPLVSLKEVVDTLNSEPNDDLDAMQRLSVETITRQTDNIMLLVDDLLTMARLEQGIQPSDYRQFAPLTVLRETVDSLSGFSLQRQVQVHLDTDTELPLLWIDPLHLKRILTNLLSNAIKYTRSGGQVWIRAYEIATPEQVPNPSHTHLSWSHADDHSLVIAFEDTGVGIRAQDQAQIFTRFFRSENPLSVEVGGTGLGLAITHSLVELHQGQIGFWSVEEQGSCFWVRFPLFADARVHTGYTPVEEQVRDG